MSSEPAYPQVTGHCLCGKVRYRAIAAPIWVGYCHCPSCRRATGSVIAPYAGYRPQDLVFEGEAPARYASSPDVVRQFCGTCGTPISYESPRWPDQIHLLLGSAEHLEGLKPQGHAYCEYQVPWFEVADSLPRGRSSSSQSST
jgi:hypothetical protein